MHSPSKHLKFEKGMKKEKLSTTVFKDKHNRIIYGTW